MYEMATIASLVEGKIRQKPFVEEALRQGIINHAALANQLMPEVKKELGKKIEFSAVNMAVRRFAERLKASKVATDTFKDAKILLTSDVDIMFGQKKAGRVMLQIKCLKTSASLLFLVTRALVSENVNVQNAVLEPGRLLLLVADADGARTYEAVRRALR
jgi:hypothetical protein